MRRDQDEQKDDAKEQGALLLETDRTKEGHQPETQSGHKNQPKL